MSVELGVCRWALDCAAGAVETVTVWSLKDMTVPACDEHAEEHTVWLARQETSLNPGPEPEPECWCPDRQVLAGARRPEYCPVHGTPESRGLESAT